MLKGRRGETEVIAQFLDTCKSATSITEIQQKVNLSYYHAKELSYKLQEMGCVTSTIIPKKNPKFNSHSVTITELGRQALSKLTDANSILQEIRSIEL